MRRLIDVISLRERIDRYCPFDKATQSKHDAFDIAKSVLLYIVMTQPTIEPELPAWKWVSTSEKPPKDFEFAYVQDRSGGTGLHQYIPPWPKFTPSKQHPSGWWGDTDCVDYDYFDMQAWCRLPEPYREEENAD